MTAADLGKLATEVKQAQSLLTALEMYQFHPTQTDMVQFHEHLLEQHRGSSQAEQVQTGMETQSM